MRFASTWVVAATILTCPPRSSAADSVLAGTVVDSVTGAPVRNAHVSVVSEGHEVETDAAGKFRFASLAPGRYLLVASKIGFDEDSGAEVELTASTANVVIRLTPLASIRGRITDQEGDPLSGVVVVALQSLVEEGFRRYEVARQTTSDDRGQYRLPLLPAGRYLVQAVGRDEHSFFGESISSVRTQEAFAPVYFGGAPDRASATTLALAPGETARADISLVLQAGHRVTGRIRNLKPHTQPVVQLLSGEQSLGVNRSSLHFASGEFRIDDVLDGEYLLRVLGVDESDRPVVAEQKLHVSGSDVVNLTLALGDGVTVKGSARVEGPPIDGDRAEAGFFIRLQHENELSPVGRRPILASGLPDDSFELYPALSGRYRVFFQAPAPFYVSSARVGDADLLADARLALNEHPAPPIEVALRSDGGSLEGSIAPVAIRDRQVYLLLAPEALNRPPVVTCTLDGAFRFEGIAPGSYRLHAWKRSPALESLAYNEPDVLRSLASTGTRVEIRAAATTRIQLTTVSESLPQ